MLSYTEGDLIFQGAESKLYASDFYGTPAVSKVRFEKRFRHRQLDERLRQQRTLREARALARCCRHHIRAPTLYFVDRERCTLCMERIDGATVKEVLDREEARLAAAAPAAAPSPLVAHVLRGLGHVVARMHMADIIHGDLTTCNFLCTATAAQLAALREDAVPPAGIAEALVVIDFGLVQEKTSDEERAVDLYVLEKALLATHNYLEHCAVALVLAGYTEAMVRAAEGGAEADAKAVRNAKNTPKRCGGSRRCARGAKRSMVG
ncbi:TP53 regulating kinase [Strigomonas culicis]|uniref:non-specific serine/threonine protein kinase n=1 Tax=Strigomonas culicis TaxID=28005 RepID=S9VML1_9TRYP|nr:TP53 regulating kinase [Strigomonas culicis]|eukprot:EPY28386.1 TP53 regulating kinase [Strigomonas culicis]